jgi:hypothetical protein
MIEEKKKKDEFMEAVKSKIFWGVSNYLFFLIFLSVSHLVRYLCHLWINILPVSSMDQGLI